MINESNQTRQRQPSAQRVAAIVLTSVFALSGCLEPKLLNHDANTASSSSQLEGGQSATGIAIDDSSQENALTQSLADIETAGNHSKGGSETSGGAASNGGGESMPGGGSMPGEAGGEAMGGCSASCGGAESHMETNGVTRVFLESGPNAPLMYWSFRDDPNPLESKGSLQGYRLGLQGTARLTDEGIRFGVPHGAAVLNSFADALLAELQSSGGLTLIIRFKPAMGPQPLDSESATEGGRKHSRILSWSRGLQLRNLMLGQVGYDLGMRLRVGEGDNPFVSNGCLWDTAMPNEPVPPCGLISANSPLEEAAGAGQWVVAAMTWRNGSAAELWLNGSIIASAQPHIDNGSQAFANWSPEYAFILGEEVDDNLRIPEIPYRAWRGTISHVSLFAEALEPDVLMTVTSQRIIP